MCGLAGLYYFNQQTSGSAAIRQMTDCIAHRGPDAEGFYNDEQVALGHRRLSIIDLSANSNQPFHEASGRYVIIFNGEIYNYQEVKKLLPGYPYRTTSDTEVVVAAFAKWGTDCMKYFKGMFAFAIWDRQERELTVVRDRFGVKPLYYYSDDKVLVFASEVRSILQSGLVKKKLDERGLYEYFSFQSVSAPLSIVSGVKQLEAGHFLSVKNGQVQSSPYWSMLNSPIEFDWNDKPAVYKEIKRLMTNSVERRLVSDVPVGAFLSGGIDSSAIVGLMATVSPQKPRTFNIYFDEPDYDESGYADIIARKFNTDHKRIRLRPYDFMSELETAIAAMDSPSGDGINTYVVSKAIRNAGIKVALSGLGGDELFAGYPVFKQFLQMQRSGFWWSNTGAIRKALAALIPASNTRQERMKSLLRLGNCNIESFYPLSRRIIAPEQLARLTTLPAVTTALQQSLSDVRDKLHRLPLLSQVTAAELMGYTQHTLLKDTDQMSMASSLEVREPFFDHELVAFIMSVPDSLKNPVYPKSLLVESLKPMLPDEIVFRKKKGFTFPWQHWMKNELRSFCEQRIKRIAQREFMHAQAINNLWQKFVQGDPGVRWAEVWLFIVLEEWLERNEFN